MFGDLGSMKRRLRRFAIQLGFVRRLKFRVAGKSVIFPNPRRSNLLLRIALFGEDAYEGELVLFLKKYPWTVDVFFDIGANVGLYSSIASLTFGENVTVKAVEPFPENVSYLKKLKEKNNLPFRVIDKALSASRYGKQPMYFPTAKNSSFYSSSASLKNSFSGSGGVFDNLPYQTVTVETATLAEIIDVDDSNCLIKLDCEGSELEILKSAREILERDDVDWIIELLIGDKYKDEIFSYLMDFGYVGYLITNGGLVREESPLTLPSPEYKNRTLWKNHFFSKRPETEVMSASSSIFR